MGNDICYDGVIDEGAIWKTEHTATWFRVYVGYKVVNAYIKKSFFKSKLYWKLYAWWYKIPSWIQELQ